MSYMNFNDLLKRNEIEKRELEQLNTIYDSDGSVFYCRGSKYKKRPRFLTKLSEYKNSVKVNTSLYYNKLCENKYNRIEELFILKSQLCAKRLKEVQASIAATQKIIKYRRRYVMYPQKDLKDPFGFHAQDSNEDTKLTEIKMADYSQLNCESWSARDRSALLKLMVKVSRKIKKQQLKSNIIELNLKFIADPSFEIKQQIKECKTEISKVYTLKLKDVALPIDEEYNWCTIAHKLNDRHTPNECRAMWKLCLHPSIKKTKWTKVQQIALQNIVDDENKQTWDEVAKKLNEQTNVSRTGYQCFIYYNKNIKNTDTVQKWTKEEIEHLKKLVNIYKRGTFIPWGKVAMAMKDKTSLQVYNKYRSLSVRRKGRFLQEEDAVILACYKKYGANFQKIAEYVPGRTAAQCRLRHKVLGKNKSVVWTVKEDKKLIDIMSIEGEPINYSSVATNFPGKHRGHIRVRYLTLKKWMRMNPYVDISKAPRRAARQLAQNTLSLDLDQAVAQLEKRIQAQVNDTKDEEITIETSEDVIDAALVEFGNKEKCVAGCQHFPEEVVADFSYTFNTNMLLKVLLLMKASLNKEQFTKSPFSYMYWQLLETHKEASPMKFRSYSKKPYLEHIMPIHDIWGGSTLEKITHGIPPTYETITSIKKFWSYLNKKPPRKEFMSFKVFARRNALFKKEFETLCERFNFLYFWPMLLSRSPADPSLFQPIDSIGPYEYYQPSTVREGRLIAFVKEHYFGVGAIPQNIPSNEVNEVIDLCEPSSSQDVNVKDFRFEF